MKLIYLSILPFGEMAEVFDALLDTAVFEGMFVATTALCLYDKGQASIGLPHVAESIQYRALDRKLWG